MSEISDFLSRFLGRISQRWLIKNKRIAILSILIIIGSCFFYAQNRYFGLKSYTSDYLAEHNSCAGDFNSEIQKSLKDKKLVFEEDRFMIKTPSQEEMNKLMANDKLKKEIYAMVGDSPMKEMVPYVAEKNDRRLAALVVGIAKKESDWGRHSPSKNGESCYNFWGYKGAGSRGTAMGYGCFATAEEGVDVIAAKIEDLIKKKLDSPARLVVWKCGSSCAGHDPAGVKKWISDVSLYYNKIVKT